MGLVALFDILRDEAEHRVLEAEAGKPADDHRRDPDDDEDAVLEIAHPAGHQHLADIGDRGADDANDKGDHGDAAGDRAVVAGVEDAVGRLGERQEPRLQRDRDQALDEAEKGKPHRNTPHRAREASEATGRAAEKGRWTTLGIRPGQLAGN